MESTAEKVRVKDEPMCEQYVFYKPNTKKIKLEPQEVTIKTEQRDVKSYDSATTTKSDTKSASKDIKIKDEPNNKENSQTIENTLYLSDLNKPTTASQKPANQLLYKWYRSYKPYANYIKSEPQEVTVKNEQTVEECVSKPTATEQIYKCNYFNKDFTGLNSLKHQFKTHIDQQTKKSDIKSASNNNQVIDKLNNKESSSEDNEPIIKSFSLSVLNNPIVMTNNRTIEKINLKNEESYGEEKSQTVEFQYDEPIIKSISLSVLNNPITAASQTRDN